MSIITTPEFFINMKSVPTKDSMYYEDFIKSEIDKLKYGLTINGVFISNWLYWHINYWKIYRPFLDERNGEVIDRFENPQLRDNEWLIADYLEQAREQKKGLIIIGSRRLAKTTFASSYIGLGATIYEGSQNIVVGNNKSDLTNITTQMDKGLSGVESFLRYGRISNDWKKEVSLGWKDKKNIAIEWSRILIRNTEDGNATELLAGTTPKTLYYDEIAKAPVKEVFNAAIPSFASPFGWRCVPILTATGGNFKTYADAQDMFNNPETYNLLAIELPNQPKKRGVFIDATMSIDIPKIEQSLSTFLKIPKGSELDDIKIQVSDRELGTKIVNEKLEQFKKANDWKEYLKQKMYAPLSPDDCFLTDDGENHFNIEACKKHLEFLKASQQKEYIRLYRDTDGKVKHSFDTNKKPVTDFPVNKDTNKDGCIIVYGGEFPSSNPPYGLFIAGSDPYNQNKSNNSSSLGTIYIYKRFYDPINGTYQNRIVASYAARPDTMKQWFETVELLLEWYNAVCMIENEGTNFIQHMETKNKGLYLADGHNLAREINPKSTITGRVKGLPATTKVQDHYKNLIIQYCDEELIIGTDANGESIKALGLTRIPDEMLIVEFINYRKGGNFDRYVAFGHALTYDESLRKTIPTVKVIEESQTTEYQSFIKSPFIINKRDNDSHRTRSPFI